MSFTYKLTIADADVQIQMNHTHILPLSQMVELGKRLVRQLLEEWIKGQQKQVLQQLLGDKWQRLPDPQIGLGCPECGSIHLRRKAWRDRRIAVDGLGRLSVSRRQLYCCDCNHCWMPFAEDLHLPSGSYGPGLVSRAMDRLLETSYQKAAEADPDGPSATSLHRLVQQLESPSAPEQATMVGTDGTRIPAWRESGQISVVLAHGLGPRREDTAPNGRPKPRDRQVVAVTAGREAQMAEALRPIDIQALVHDGNLQLDDQADHVGRCRWHVPYTVKYLLYRDKIRGRDNKQRVGQLREYLQRSQGNPEGLKARLQQWLDDNEDAPVACRHVAGSLQGLLTMANHPKAFTVQTTSHLEREMVEINKRFENGGGWSARGARNLLWLHQLKRFEPEKYTQVKQQLIERTVFPN